LISHCAARFETLRRELDKGFVGTTLPDTAANPNGREPPHSVFWQIGRRIAGGGHLHRRIYEIEAGDSWRKSAHRESLFALITSP
jgi:hypothetical protein